MVQKISRSLLRTVLTAGVVCSFGVNSEAVLKAAVADVNKKGGVKLANGSRVKLVHEYYNSAINVDNAIAIVRKVAAKTPTLIGIVPIFSAAAAMFRVFQESVGFNTSTGLTASRSLS